MKEKDVNENQSQFNNKKYEVQTLPHPHKKYSFLLPERIKGSST